MAWTLEQSYAFVYLSWLGATLTAQRIFDRFWEIADQQGVPRNPYRVGFVQSVVVSETDERAETEYGRYVESAFRQGVGSVPLHYLGLPGYVDIRGVEAMLRDPGDFGMAAELKHIAFKRLAETRAVIAGSPATVRDQIVEFVERFRIGNLLVMLQMGGMPHELTLKNISLFTEEVLPRLREVWSGEGWENDWWPAGIGQRAASGDAVEA